MVVCALIWANSSFCRLGWSCTWAHWLTVCFSPSLPRCQNWEGGIGGVPGMEAHGGYTFCGLAALVILKKERCLNLKSLLVSSSQAPDPCDVTAQTCGPWDWSAIGRANRVPALSLWAESCHKASDAVVRALGTALRKCKEWTSALHLGPFLPPSPFLLWTFHIVCGASSWGFLSPSDIWDGPENLPPTSKKSIASVS